MRVVTNEQKIKRNRRFGNWFTLSAMGVLIGGLVLNTVMTANFNTAVVNILLFVVPCVIMPIGLILMVVGLRYTNEFIRQPHAHDAVEASLKGIDKRSILYHYLPPANHILVTPLSVYVIHTLYQSGRTFRVTGEQWTDPKARGPFGPMFQFIKQDGIGKPFVEVDAAAARVQQVIEQTLPGRAVEIQSVVALLAANAQVEVSEPLYPVVYADLRRKPSLKSLIREEKVEKQKRIKGEAKPAESPISTALTDAELMKLYEALTMTAAGFDLSDSGLDDDSEAEA